MTRDVLATILETSDDLRAEGYIGLAIPLEEARAAVAELIDAAEAYAKAEADLAGRELEGINAESIDRLQPRVHAARRDLESALNRVRGAA